MLVIKYPIKPFGKVPSSKMIKKEIRIPEKDRAAEVGLGSKRKIKSKAGTTSTAEVLYVSFVSIDEIQQLSHSSLFCIQCIWWWYWYILSSAVCLVPKQSSDIINVLCWLLDCFMNKWWPCMPKHHVLVQSIVVNTFVRYFYDVFLFLIRISLSKSGYCYPQLSTSLT